MDQQEDNNKISVVCPAYNAEKYILRALESVFGQTLSPYELIVSDDGSTDKTVELVEKYLKRFSPSFSTTFLRHNHQGPGAARNRGVKEATGDWIAFLDADDYWTRDKLAVVLEYIKKFPEKNFFCHDEIYLPLNGRQEVLDYGRKYKENWPLEPQLFLRNFFSTSAVVLKKEIIEKLGFFDETLPQAQDYELWLRMSPYLRPHFIKKTLGYYVEVEGSISSISYWQKYRYRLRIAWRHRQKASFFSFIILVAYLTLSKNWLTIFSSRSTSRVVGVNQTSGSWWNKFIRLFRES